jgi:hypothetical protein
VNSNINVQPVMAIGAHPVWAPVVFLGLPHMMVMLQIPSLQWSDSRSYGGWNSWPAEQDKRMEKYDSN